MASGVEVLGAIAATEQLARTALSVINVLIDLRKRIRDAPAKIRCWQDELMSLAYILASIRESRWLQTAQIADLVQGISRQIDRLYQLVSVTFIGGGPIFKQYYRALRKKPIEAQIVQALENLERSKSSLGLAMSQRWGSMVPEFGERAGYVSDLVDENFPSHDISPNHTELTRRLPEHFVVYSYPSPAASQDPNQPSRPHGEMDMAARERSSFKGCSIDGDGSAIGNDNGEQSNFDESKILGSASTIGHQAATSLTARAKLLSEAAAYAKIKAETAARKPSPPQMSQKDQHCVGPAARNPSAPGKGNTSAPQVSTPSQTARNVVSGMQPTDSSMQRSGTQDSGFGEALSEHFQDKTNTDPAELGTLPHDCPKSHNDAMDWEY